MDPGIIVLETTTTEVQGGEQQEKKNKEEIPVIVVDQVIITCIAYGHGERGRRRSAAFALHCLTRHVKLRYLLVGSRVRGDNPLNNKTIAEKSVKLLTLLELLTSDWIGWMRIEDER